MSEERNILSAELEKIPYQVYKRAFDMLNLLLLAFWLLMIVDYLLPHRKTSEIVTGSEIVEHKRYAYKNYTGYC